MEKQNLVTNLWRLKVILWLAFLPLFVAAGEFVEAEEAAKQGRYRDVAEILGTAIDSHTLDANSMLVALSNRGIAYSLLSAYGLAKQDLIQALEIDSNHTLSLNHLGLLAEKVDYDYELAASYYSKAAAGDFPASESNLANLYLTGQGVEQNESVAFDLYRSAASKKYGMAFLPLGLMYLEGLGTSRNTKRARELLKLAVEEGVINAHYHLGVLFERGVGGSRDIKEAVSNYSMAAVQGHGEAQNALGYMYRRGIGVKQDLMEAARWYDLASEQGNAGAKNRLSWLLAGCPTTQLCDGKRAIELALEAVASAPTVSNRDSLAAAYARAGQFDSAISILQRMLDELPRDHASRRVYQRRLDGYRNGVPHQL